MKKMLSVLMTLVLVFGALSVTALAAEPEDLGDINVTVTGDEVGKSAADLKVEVPADAHCSVKSVKVKSVDLATGDTTDFTGTFEDGKLYEMEIILDVQEGYDPGTTYLRINGVYADDWYQIDNNDDGVGDQLVIEHRLSFLRNVESVAVTGMQEPKVGDEMATTGFSVPADAPYTIDKVHWENDAWDDLPAGTKFEDGKRYYLVIELKSKDGWQFTRETAATIDGEEVWDTEEYTTEFEIYEEVSFKTPIDKFEVIGLDAPVAGQAVDTQVTVKMDGQELPVTVTWCDEEGNEVTKFGEKGLYEVEVRADYPQDHEIVERTMVYVNGKPSMSGGYSISCICLEKIYFLGYKTLDKVELTLDGFEEGKDSADAKITAKDWKIMMPMWGVGDLAEAEAHEGKFENGKKYILMVALDLPEETVVDDTTKVYLNGQLQKDAFLEYRQGAVSVYVPDLELKKPATPVTGDNTPVMALAAVMVLSAVMLVALPVTMKRKEQ